MFRGMTNFKCAECGHQFRGMDLEWYCTVFTAPAKCPNCGSWHTAPRHSSIIDPIYKSIWKSIDERQK